MHRKVPGRGEPVNALDFGGSETNYDIKASQFQVCAGFGIPQGLEISWGFMCTTIVQLAQFSGKIPEGSKERVCDYLGLGEAVADPSQWDETVAGYVCGKVSDGVAVGLGVAAAGAAAETGPGAVAVGVATYKSLDAFLQISCSAAFDGAAHNLGVWLEAKHQTHVRNDIIRGKCLQSRTVFGYLKWSAVDCE